MGRTRYLLILILVVINLWATASPASAFSMGGISITAVVDASGDCGATPSSFIIHLSLSAPLSGTADDGGSGLDYAMWVVFDGNNHPVGVGSVAVQTGLTIPSGTFPDNAINDPLPGIVPPAAPPFTVHAYDTDTGSPGSVAAIMGYPQIASSSATNPSGFISAACAARGIGSSTGTAAAPPPVPTDGRINRYGEPGAVYADATGIFMYGIDGSSKGHLKTFVPASQLIGLRVNPPRNTLLAASADGKFAIFWLTTGEYQANIGPDEYGKVYVTVFRGAPARDIYHYDYIGGPFLPAPGAPANSSPATNALPAPAAGSGNSYVVQRGDTLYSIARRFGLTVEALAAANGISDPSRIFAGQALTIP